MRNISFNSNTGPEHNRFYLHSNGNNNNKSDSISNFSNGIVKVQNNYIL